MLLVPYSLIHVYYDTILHNPTGISPLLCHNSSPLFLDIIYVCLSCFTVSSMQHEELNLPPPFHTNTHTHTHTHTNKRNMFYVVLMFLWHPLLVPYSLIYYIPIYCDILLVSYIKIYYISLLL